MGKSSAPEEGADDVPLRGTPGHLILAGMPWVTSRFPSILISYNIESLSELNCLVLYTKLSSCPWAHMSGRVGSTDRSASLLEGRARLSGTAETLITSQSTTSIGYPSISVALFKSLKSIHTRSFPFFL
jgi:hypothetical protein